MCAKRGEYGTRAVVPDHLYTAYPFVCGQALVEPVFYMLSGVYFKVVQRRFPGIEGGRFYRFESRF